MSRAFSLFAALLIIGVIHNSLLAASPAGRTAIFVHNMHCSNCAKKIAGQLYAVPGVLQVQANVKKNLAVVVPQQQRQPSPRAMWEAVLKAGFKPVKIEGPLGTYTSLPPT